MQQSRFQNTVLVLAWAIFFFSLAFCIYVLWLYPENRWWSFFGIFLVVIPATRESFFEKSAKKNPAKSAAYLVAAALSIPLICKDEIRTRFRDDCISHTYQFRFFITNHPKHPFNLAGDLFLPTNPPFRFGFSDYGNKFGRSYSWVYHTLIHGSPQDKARLHDPFELALDCVEHELFSKLSWYSLNGWASKQIDLSIGSERALIGGLQTDVAAGREGLPISDKAAMGLFHLNPLFKFSPVGILLPPGTKVSIKRGIRRLPAEWIFENDYVRISLELIPRTGGAVAGAVWGITNDEPIYKMGVAITGRFSAEFRNSRLGDREMPLYRIWVDNFQNALMSLDWGTIQGEMDKEAVRKTALIMTQNVKSQ